MKAYLIVCFGMIAMFIAGYFVGKDRSPLEYPAAQGQRTGISYPLVLKTDPGPREQPVREPVLVVSKFHQDRIQTIREAQVMSLPELIENIEVSFTALSYGRTSSSGSVAIYIDSLIELDPGGALGLLKQNQQLIGAVNMLLERWVKLDFDGALQFYLDHPDEKLLGHRLLSSESITDHPAADSVAENYGQEGQGMLDATRLLQQDPILAMEAMLADPRLQNNRELIASIATRLPESEFQNALEKATVLQDQGFRQLFIRTLISRKSERSATQTLEIIDQVFEVGSQGRRVAMQAFTATVGRDASEAILQFSRTHNDYDLLLGYLGSTPNLEFSQILPLIEQVPRSQLGRGNLYGFANAIAQRDPEEVYAWIESVSSDHPELIQAVIRSMGRQQSDFLQEKLLYETNEELVASIARMLALSRAQADPIGAIDFLEEYSDSNFYSRTMREVTRRWAVNQPRQMLEYAAEHPSDDVFKSVGRASSVWYQRDPDSALEWATGVEDAALRDMSISGIAASMARQDPEGALTLSKVLPADVAEETRFRIAINWLPQDRDQAEAIIDRVDVNSTYEARLRSFVERSL